MSTEETRRVVSSYLADHGGEWLAEQVSFFEPGSAEPHIGRRRVAEWLGRFYGGAFSEALADPRTLVVDENRAACEFVFSGVHTGSLFDERPTGRRVSIPMAAVYDVGAGEIVAARVYYDAGRLRDELTTPSRGGEPPRRSVRARHTSGG